MGFKIRGPESKQKDIQGGEVQSAFGYIRRQKWTNPVAKSAVLPHAAITLLATVQTITTGITQPDFARILTVKGVMAGGSLTGNVVLTGTDIRGNVITDTIALNDNGEVAGVKAFKTLTSIALPVRVTAADTVSIGRADNLGLDRVIAGNETFGYTVDGAKETVPTITFNTDISRCTILFPTALANTKVYVASYIAVEKTTSTATTA